MKMSRRAQWWAPEHDSMATMHPGGGCAHQAMNLSRGNALFINNLLVASTA